MNTVYIQLGSNLGDRRQFMCDATQAIEENIKVESALSAEDILICILQIEKDLGRVRVEKWGQRLIDIDIIFFNNEIIETVDLCIPHKHMHERNFVLIPLNEIASSVIHPRYKKTVFELLDESRDIEKVQQYLHQTSVRRLLSAKQRLRLPLQYQKKFPRPRVLNCLCQPCSKPLFV